MAPNSRLLDLHPRFCATMVGSMPQTDAEDAVRRIVQAVPDAPVWPQLPNRDWSEHFLVQYGWHLPCKEADAEKRKFVITGAEDCADDLAGFYEKALLAEETGELDAFALSPDFAPGFFALERYLQQCATPPNFAKVQVIGPISFGLGLKDLEGRLAFFREDFRDALIRAVSLQARWQIRRISPLCGTAICFLDEPYLQSFGSMEYISLSREDAVAAVKEACDAVKSEGAVAGVHVCGKTDWSLLTEAEVDLLNFDAYTQGDSLGLYTVEINRFLERGGIVAWGIVPTVAADIDKESPESLADRLDALLDRLAAQGIDRDRLIDRSMVTPACGLGTLSVEHADKAGNLLKDTAAILQKRHG